jgi:hypothetical protein
VQECGKASAPALIICGSGEKYTNPPDRLLRAPRAATQPRRRAA